jgi:hypothetical protein
MGGLHGPIRGEDRCLTPDTMTRWWATAACGFRPPHPAVDKHELIVANQTSLRVRQDGRPALPDGAPEGSPVLLQPRP